MQLHFLSISKLKMQQRHKRKIQNILPRISKQSASNLKHMNQQLAKKKQAKRRNKSENTTNEIARGKLGSTSNINPDQSFTAAVVELTNLGENTDGFDLL